MSQRAGSTGIDASLYRREGPWCTAFVDASRDTFASSEASDALPDRVAGLLGGLHAPEADIAAMRAALVPAEGRPAPVGRFVAVNGGQVLVDELVPAEAGPPQVDCGPFPNLVPLARARGGQIPYIVAEVGRDGGEVTLRHSAAPGVAEKRSVATDPDEAHHAKRVPGEYSESTNQHQTAEIWRRNADEIARHIDEVARTSGARLVVLAGDVKARELVLSQLSEATRAIATSIEQHTRTGGADQAVAAAEIEARVAEVLADDLNNLAETLGNRGNGNKRAVVGFDAVVDALQQAQADTVLVCGFQDEHSLLALAAEPWIATEEAGSPGTDAIGSWPAPVVLLRAAALTDASLRYVPEGFLPEGAGIAALLRWPKAPED